MGREALQLGNRCFALQWIASIGLLEKKKGPGKWHKPHLNQCPIFNQTKQRHKYSKNVIPSILWNKNQLNKDTNL